jgi:streptomycin 6-kinase
MGCSPRADRDLGVMTRNDPLELLDGDPGLERRWLAAHCELDATAIWDWGVVERATSGLRRTHIDLEPLGRQMLMVANRLAPL